MRKRKAGLLLNEDNEGMDVDGSGLRGCELTCSSL